MVGEGAGDVGGGVDEGRAQVFVAARDHHVSSDSEGGESSFLEREEVGGPSALSPHEEEDLAAERGESMMDGGRNVSILGLPFGFDVELGVEGFLGDEGPAREEDLGEEVFLEASEGRCWAAVDGSRDGDEFEPQADYGAEVLRHDRTFMVRSCMAILDGRVN